MSQFPHDDFAKNFLDSLLSPFGIVQPSHKIVSEVRYVDIYFQPRNSSIYEKSLGLLAKFANNPIVIEPFRNSVKAIQICSCMSKLFDISYLAATRHRQPDRRNAPS